MLNWKFYNKFYSKFAFKIKAFKHIASKTLEIYSHYKITIKPT